MANIIFGYFPASHPLLRRRAWAGSGLLAALLLTAGTVSAGFPNFGSLTRDRTQGEALYQQAYTAYRDGDYPRALQLTEQADKIKPDQADGWNLRGVLFLKQRDYAKAEAAFNHAAACDPELWATQFNLAEVPYQKKDFARARDRFERLLAQTDRFKDTRKWEMVLYKTFLSYLFLGDEAGATKKLARLVAAPGSSPVSAYANAALAFRRKDAVGAEKMLAAAQSKFPQETNDLFSEPLVQAGWINVLPPNPAILAGPSGPLPGGGAPALGAASAAANNRQPVVIDPRLEAAAAEPLPEQDGAVRPMLGKVVTTRTPPPAPVTMAATPAPPKVPAGPRVANVTPTVPPSLPDTSLEHSGLLLE